MAYGQPISVAERLRVALPKVTTERFSNREKTRRAFGSIIPLLKYSTSLLKMQVFSPPFFNAGFEMHVMPDSGMRIRRR